MKENIFQFSIPLVQANHKSQAQLPILAKSADLKAGPHQQTAQQIFIFF